MLVLDLPLLLDVGDIKGVMGEKASYHERD
jgi:hypothetical protein